MKCLHLCGNVYCKPHPWVHLNPTTGPTDGSYVPPHFTDGTANYGGLKHLPGWRCVKGDIEDPYIYLKAGPPSGWGMRGRILRWSPRLPTPLALTPALEYGWDLWIWWNSTPTTRLPIIYLWVDQKEYYPGWVWPNQGSLSKEMKHLENFRKYTAMLWTVWWKGGPLEGPWDPWDLVLRLERMVSANNLKELRRWPCATM